MEFPNKAVRKMYWRYYCQARNRGLDFELSKELFISLVTSPNCYYCGCEPYQTSYDVPVIGIDRKDNNLGYFKDNCVPCCKGCNYKKGRQSFTAFIKKYHPTKEWSNLPKY